MVVTWTVLESQPHIFSLRISHFNLFIPDSESISCVSEWLYSKYVLNSAGFRAKICLISSLWSVHCACFFCSVSNSFNNCCGKKKTHLVYHRATILMQNQKALLGILFVTNYLVVVVVVVQPPQGLKPCSSVIRLKKRLLLCYIWTYRSLGAMKAQWLLFFDLILMHI